MGPERKKKDIVDHSYKRYIEVLAVPKMGI